MGTREEDSELRTERVHVMMTKEEVRQIDDWGFANRIRGRAEALRRLVKRGLEAESGKTEPEPPST